MYHIAWEVPTLADLEEMRDRLAAAGALKGASDHGANKSLYAMDPDGLEFEVMWLVPAEHWGDAEHEAIIEPLDIAGERQRFARGRGCRDGAVERERLPPGQPPDRLLRGAPAHRRRDRERQVRAG